MKKIYLLTLLLILIFSISAVSADELNDTLTNDNDSGIEVETDDNSTIIGND